MKQNIDIFIEKLRKAESVAIFAHKNPDADALCSVLALARLIELNFGLRATCVYDGNIPENLENVPFRKRIRYWENVDMTMPFDLAIALDYGTVRHIGGAMPIVDRARFIVEIDHHKNDAPIANLCLDDVAASSVGEILYEIMRYCDWKTDESVAELLALSILTDTGFFKFARRGNALRIMADLVDSGVSINKLADWLNNKPRRAVQVESAAASLARFYHHNRLAIAVIPKKDYKHLDGRGDTVLNLLGQMKGVEYIALLKQQKENQTGVSLRSRSRPIDGVAAALGGGGHAYAAGAVVADTVENVQAKLVELFRGM